MRQTTERGEPRGFLKLMGAAVAATLVALPAQAAPVQYVFDHPSGSSGPAGWFIYDRDAPNLIDYSISFPCCDPLVTFTYPAANVFSANHGGFSFSDVTTAVGPNPYGGTQPFTVWLGSWNEYFGPAQVTFADKSLGGSSDGAGHDIIGTMTTPIYYQGTASGGVMFLAGGFYELGPVGSVTSPVPEPESGAMLLAGLGLLELFAWRRKTQAA